MDVRLARCSWEGLQGMERVAEGNGEQCVGESNSGSESVGEGEDVAELLGEGDELAERF